MVRSYWSRKKTLEKLKSQFVILLPTKFGSWDNAMRNRVPNKMLGQEKISTIKFGILLTQLNYLKKNGNII